MKAAVIYYSKAGTTKKIAEKIAAAFNADLHFVEPEKAYGSYISAVIRVAGEKIRKKDPALKSKVADFSSYDTVFIGFPVWYSTMPNHLQEYVSKADLAGKRVIPFATAGANGKESSLETVKKLCPKSNITDYFYTSMTSKGDVDAWLKGIKG